MSDRGGRGPRGGGHGDRGIRGGRPQRSSYRSTAFSIEGYDATRILSAQMQQLSVNTSTNASTRSTDLLPLRPAFGSQGKRVVVWANYFQLDVLPKVVYKYQILTAQLPTSTDKSPEAKTRVVKGRKLHLVVQEMLEQLGTNNSGFLAVTEFKNSLYTLEPLHPQQSKCNIRLPYAADEGKFDTVEVSFEGPTMIDFKDVLSYANSTMDDAHELSFPRFPDAVDALNAIMGHLPRSRLGEIVATGSGKFFPFDETKKIYELFNSSRALIAARGHFQSVRISTGRLLLNVNTVHGVFKASGPLNAILDSIHLKAAPKGHRDIRRLKILMAIGTMEKMVKLPKVINSIARASDFVHQKSAKRPKFTPGWDFAGPKNIQFWQFGKKGETGRYVTIFDYYKEKYGTTLGDYPVVNAGSLENPVFFPAEFVEVQLGQKAMVKLPGDETTAMLDFACRTPFANAVSISTDARKTLSLDENQYLENFGLTVGRKLLPVHARILSAPAVSYLSGDGKKRVDQIPQNGSWNMRSVRVVKPGRMIERWSWVNVLIQGTERPVGKNVISQFGTFMSKNMGINIHPPMEPRSQFIHGKHAMDGGFEKIFDWAQRAKLQFLLFILSEKDSEGIYTAIKRLGDCIYGIQTSCVVGNKFAKAQPGYFANVGLKWNLKAGGDNHGLRDETELMKEGRLMVAGYDVTHSTNRANRNTDAPSLVGLVASIDGSFSQWPSVSWEQTSRQEMTSNKMIEAFVSRINLWKQNNNGMHPLRIIIFRDGVSEGQFAQVLDKELPLIREACRRSCPATDLPRLAIIVSVKRHQTRFYPTSTSPEQMSNSGNVRNGTVVDRGITQVRHWDFFLTAHDALQGTARPAHYSVLLDEIFRDRFKGAAADELEKITHELCYLFGRATKAVSICPPAYYADIVCERARAHRPEWFDASDVESVSTSSRQASSKEGEGIQVHEAVRDTMYYV
ncbi:Protein argonaute-2 [Paramyrothecium foliicola]|nr:Protein argonaute-2 [Paramyrothecium foliicola]